MSWVQAQQQQQAQQQAHQQVPAAMLLGASGMPPCLAQHLPPGLAGLPGMAGLPPGVLRPMAAGTAMPTRHAAEPPAQPVPREPTGLVPALAKAGAEATRPPPRPPPPPPPPWTAAAAAAPPRRRGGVGETAAATAMPAPVALATAAAQRRHRRWGAAALPRGAPSPARSAAEGMALPPRSPRRGPLRWQGIIELRPRRWPR